MQINIEKNYPIAKKIFDGNYENACSNLEKRIEELDMIKDFIVDRTFANLIISKIETGSAYMPNSLKNKTMFDTDEAKYIGINYYVKKNLKKAKIEYGTARRLSNLIIATKGRGNSSENYKEVTRIIDSINNIDAEISLIYNEVRPYAEDIIENALMLKANASGLQIRRKGAYNRVFDKYLDDFLTENTIKLMKAEADYRLSNFGSGEKIKRDFMMKDLVSSVRSTVNYIITKKKPKKNPFGFECNYIKEIPGIKKALKVNFNKNPSLENATKYIAWVYKNVLDDKLSKNISTNISLNTTKKKTWYYTIYEQKRELFSISKLDNSGFYIIIPIDAKNWEKRVMKESLENRIAEYNKKTPLLIVP